MFLAHVHDRSPTYGGTNFASAPSVRYALYDYIRLVIARACALIYTSALVGRPLQGAVYNCTPPLAWLSLVEMRRRENAVPERPGQSADAVEVVA